MPLRKTKEPPDKCIGVNCNVSKPPYRTIKTSLKSILRNNALLEPLNTLVLK